MLKPVTAQDLIKSVNDSPNNQFKIARPWWWIGSSDSYTKRVVAEADMLRSFDEKAEQAGGVIKEAAQTLTDGAAIIDWIKNNPKVAALGAVALILLIRKG